MKTVNILYCLFLALLVISCAEEPTDKALGMGSLELSPITHALQIGETIQYQAKYFDSRGDEQTNVTINWQSTDTSIATIDDRGKVITQAQGQVNINATATFTDTASNITQSALLSVVENIEAVAFIELSDSDNAVVTGADFILTAIAKNLNNETLFDIAYTWLSSDEEIATVDASGYVQTQLAGMVEITASADGIQSKVFQLTVRDESNNRTATFQAADYATSGTATLMVNPDGQLALSFSSDFRVDSGPQLEVFLSNTSTPTQNSINLGGLKSNSGTQVYTLPNTILITDFNYVSIHCVPYDVTFGFGNFVN